MVRKIFTPSEANRSLPLVRNIVTDILSRARELRGHEDPPRNPSEEEAREEIQQDILGMMEELESLGASFKDWDFDVGLVEFFLRAHVENHQICGWISDRGRSLVG